MDSIFRYYSQNGEDFILWKFFDFKPDGVFIDVGAFDGIHLSNSYSFEQKGWKGICIEPHPFYFKCCKKNRIHSVCVNMASVADEHPDEIILESDATGLFASMRYNPDLKNIIDHYGSIGKTIPKAKKYVVKARTLKNIIETNSYNDISIDFISIDVEGLELSVLDGLGLHNYSPKLLLIETSTDGDQVITTDYLSQFGYKFARRVGSNSFFVKSDEDVYRLLDIEVSCVLEKQIHPLGSAFTQEEYLEGKILYKGSNGNSLLINCSKKLLEYEKQLAERNLKVKSLLRHLDDQVKLNERLKKRLEDKIE